MTSRPASSAPAARRGGWSFASILAVALIVELVIQLAAARRATPRRPPFLGPTPTADARTWAYVPGNLLLGALVYVDEQPTTPLSADQVTALSRISTNASEREAWEERLRRIYASVLSVEQRRDVESHLDEIVALEFDPRRLLATLDDLSGRTGPRPSMSTPRTLQSALDVTFIVSALQWLVSHSQYSLSPEQAGSLALALRPWVEVVERERELRARQAAVLSAAQVSGIVDLLARAREGRLRVESFEIGANEALDHFRNKGVTQMPPLPR